MRIRDLPSLGPASEAQLAEIGIPSVEALRALGPAKAYLVLKFRYGRSISLNFLWAIECGLRGQDWRTLTADRKAELRAEVAALEAQAKGQTE